MLRPDRVFLIVNPAAGGGCAARSQSAVAGYLSKRDVKTEVVRSESSEHIRQLAREAAQAGFSAVAALGGDGTLHHLVNGGIEHDLVFGFFPAGHGNDIAPGLGIPEDPVAAAHAFLARPPRPVDVLRATFAGDRTEIYLGAGGMGLDAEAAQLVNGRFRRLPGATRYVAAGLWTLATFRPLGLKLEIDGENVRGSAIFAAVANSPSYGSGLVIAPEASMADGLLDVALVGELPFWRILEAIPIVFRTGDLRWPEIRRWRARHVELSADRPALFHGDGEVLGEAPVRVEVLPGAIRMGGTRLA